MWNERTKQIRPQRLSLNLELQVNAKVCMYSSGQTLQQSYTKLCIRSNQHLAKPSVHDIVVDEAIRGPHVQGGEGLSDEVPEAPRCHALLREFQIALVMN